MEDRILFADQLKATSTRLKGISQLLLFTYERTEREGLDGEYLLTLDDMVWKCNDELVDLIKKL